MEKGVETAVLTAVETKQKVEKGVETVARTAVETKEVRGVVRTLLVQ